jgi:hypothetical protein
MTSDPSFQGHNDYRKRFYKEVIGLADEVNYLIVHSFSSEADKSSSGRRAVK